ncbi:hypothetical protein CHUAL_009665 [Chamberlinius hualienensis]
MPRASPKFPDNNGLLRLQITKISAYIPFEWWEDIFSQKPTSLGTQLALWKMHKGPLKMGLGKMMEERERRTQVASVHICFKCYGDGANVDYSRLFRVTARNGVKNLPNKLIQGSRQRGKMDGENVNGMDRIKKLNGDNFMVWRTEIQA